MPRIRIVVRGRVQGVGFRQFTLRQARALGVEGWARNRADGDVEIEAEAPADRLDLFLAAVREGPAFARVTGVEVEALADGDPFGGFHVTG